MYEEFLEKYCIKHGISEEEALKHEIVREFLEEKKQIDKEKQVSSKKV